jgi:hypothetical protein
VSIGAFTSDVTSVNCGAWTYRVRDSAWNVLDSIFTVDNSVPKITMYTADPTKKSLSP